MLVQVYAIPKDRTDDMTNGRGLPATMPSGLDDAVDYIDANSSPDNPDRYEIRSLVTGERITP